MTAPRQACLTVLAALLCAAGLPAAAGEAPGKSDLEAERAKAAAMRLKAMAEAKKAFVKVIFTPRWDEECALEAQVSRGSSYYQSFWAGYEGRSLTSRLHQFMQLHRNKETSQAPGLLVGPGLVVIGDDGTGYEWKLVKKVEIQDAAGKRWEVEPYALLNHASALMLKVKGGGGPKSVTFRRDFKLSTTERVFGAALSRRHDRHGEWLVFCGGASLPFDAGEVKPERLKFMTGTGPRMSAWTSGGLVLLFDSEARPVGVNVGQTALSNENRAAWNVEAILSGGTVPYGKIRKAEAAARARSEKLHYKVRFEFRVEKGEDDDMFGSWTRRSYTFRGEGGGQDAETFGLSVGGGRVFVSRMLRPAALRQVEKVSVKVDGQWKKAKFLAAFKDISGMMIEVPDVKLNEPEGLYATKGVRIMKPFVYCAVRELLGKRQAFAKSTRYRARHKGYKDRMWPMATHVPVGALLFDLEGRLAGICIQERRDREMASLGNQRGYYYGRGGMTSLAAFTRLKAAFENPKKHALPTWRPMSKQESRRLVWLGVEFDPITKELAKNLKLEAPARGGAVGLIVSSVYPDSPAAKLGLQPQDILLRMEVKGLGDPVPLMSQSASEMAQRWSSMAQAMGRMSMAGMGARTWKPRANVLTGLLTSAGPDHQAEIAYYSHKEKKIKTGGFKLAYGPVDYDSAEKYKDEKLGLSVKPLTYEVRLALALKKEDPGVVISKVERGSVAQLARLSPYLLITHVEGQPVKSVENFKKTIAKLRKEAKEKVKLQVSTMGKSRFADLKLGG